MGMQDRDYYREYHREKRLEEEKNYLYNPKEFRGSKERHINFRNNSTFRNRGVNKKSIVIGIASFIAIIYVALWMRDTTTKIARHQQVTEQNRINAQHKMQEAEQQRKDNDIQQREKEALQWAQEEQMRIAKRARIEASQQETKPSEERVIVGYQQIYVVGKSANECAGKNGTVDLEAMQCIQGHYENRPVYGNK